MSKKKIIKKMIKLGEKEIEKANVMIDYYKWQKDNAPEDATKEELAKIDLKVSQMEEIIANNEKMSTSLKQFIKSI